MSSSEATSSVPTLVQRALEEVDARVLDDFHEDKTSEGDCHPVVDAHGRYSVVTERSCFHANGPETTLQRFKYRAIIRRVVGQRQW